MRTLAVGTAIVLCLAVSACAGTGGRNSVTHQDRFDGDVDVGKVVTVNQWAQHRHASVVWINYPTKALHKDTEG